MQIGQISKRMRLSNESKVLQYSDQYYRASQKETLPGLSEQLW
jgi:hypothetical protein